MLLPANDLIELEAAWTIAAALHAVPERHDVPGAPPGSYDFDLHLKTGASIALEVTTATAPELAAFWNAVRRFDWSDKALRRNWTVTLLAMSETRPTASVKSFHRDGIPLLRAIDGELGEAGIWVLVQDDPQQTDLGRRAAQALRSMGVDNANALAVVPSREQSGQIAVGASIDGAARLSTVNEVLRDAVEANADKLRRSRTTERQLFIVVNDASLSAFVEAATYSMPQILCSLPDGIDRVWLAPWLAGPDPESKFGSLWYVVDGQAWRSMPVPAVRSYALGLAGVN